MRHPVPRDAQDHQRVHGEKRTDTVIVQPILFFSCIFAKKAVPLRSAKVGNRANERTGIYGARLAKYP